MSTKDQDQQVEVVMDALNEFQAAHDQRYKSLQEQVDHVEMVMNRPDFGGSGKPAAKAKHDTWFDAKTKRPVPVLAHADSVAALDQKPSDDTPTVGRLLRGMILGGRADDARELEAERKALSISSDPGGGYTVAGTLASRWIDLLRAQMVLSRAGSMTVPMETGELSIARVTGDPEVFWHSENSSIADSEPTFGLTTLRAKTVVCLVKMSLELAQDSVNMEQMLQKTIVSAMAGAIDRAGLVGVTTNATLAPGGVTDLAGRNTVTAIGVPTNWDFLVDGMYELVLDNVPMESIGALVAHPALWKKMRKLKTGIAGDMTPLSAPPEVASLPKLWTTAAPEDAAVIADWRDLLFGVRKDIQVRVLSETFLASNLQIAVLAYARVDFAAARAQSFCTLEGLTV